MDDTARVSVTADESGTTVVASGALDLYTEGFEAPLKSASLCAEKVVVDLRSAIYIDTAILAYMAAAAKRLNARSKRLSVLLTEGAHPLRTLKMACLQTIMDLVVYPEDASETP